MSMIIVFQIIFNYVIKNASSNFDIMQVYY